MANEGNDDKPKQTLEERAKELVRDVIEAIESLIPDISQPTYVPIPAGRPPRRPSRRR